MDISNDVAKGYLRRLDAIDRSLLEEKINHLRACKPYHQDAKEIIEEAKAAHGVGKKVMRRLWAEQRLRIKLAEVGDDLDGDDAEQHEALREVFGDLIELPLFEAAAEADERKAPAPEAKSHGRRKKADETRASKDGALADLAGPGEDVDLRPPFLKDREGERAPG